MPPRNKGKRRASAKKSARAAAAAAARPASDAGYGRFSKALRALRELTTATATVLDRKLHGVHCEIREKAAKGGWGSTAANLDKAQGATLKDGKYREGNPQQWQKLYFREFEKLHAREKPVWRFLNSDARKWSSGPSVATSGAAAFKKFSEGGHVEMAKLFCASLGKKGWDEKKTMEMLDPPALLAMITNCRPLKEMTKDIDTRAKAVSQLRNRLAHGLETLNLEEKEYRVAISHLESFLQELLRVKGLNKEESGAVNHALKKISDIDSNKFTMMSTAEVKRMEELARKLHEEEERVAQLALKEAKERERDAKSEEEEVKELQRVGNSFESTLGELKDRVDR